jgi:hypothetical protein
MCVTLFDIIFSLFPFSPGYYIFSSAIQNTEIKVYKIVTFPVVLYGCET